MRRGERCPDATRVKLSLAMRRLHAQGQVRSDNNKRRQVPVLEIDDAFGHWFAGFVDGEGCFSVHIQRNGRFTPCFSIGLRGDDYQILEEVGRRLGIGRVRFARRGRGRIATYDLTCTAECVALCDLFDRFPLRSKKRFDFAAWSTVVRSSFVTYRPLRTQFRSELRAMHAVKHNTYYVEDERTPSGRVGR